VSATVRSLAQSPAAPSTQASKAAVVDIARGTSALGLALLVERGLGFLSNALAARWGGAATFGAYSLAITTANNISSYAAGGIGSTAIRFSGKYPRQHASYATFCRALLVMSLLSAGVAAFGSWAAAPTLARLLGRPDLRGLLGWAGLSAGGMILLECCRGFLVGQRRLAALTLLSTIAGIGMISLLPAASLGGPVRMIVFHGSIAVTAVCVCLLSSRALGPAPTASVRPSEPLGPMLWAVWSFGLIQLAGLIGMNAAGLWLTSLIVRADTSMVQMGFFAVAHQFRNIVALAPTLLTESGFAVMAHEEERGPDGVMAACTFATTWVSLSVAGPGLLLIPWALPILYGSSYAPALPVVAVALATAVVHMSAAPAFARLGLLSIRLSGMINTLWAVNVAAAGAIVLLWADVQGHGAAWEGALIYLGAHLLSNIIGLTALVRRRCVPKGMIATMSIGMGAALLLAVLAPYRTAGSGRLPLMSGVLILAVAFAALLRIGYHHRWLPSLESIRSLLRLRSVASSLPAQPLSIVSNPTDSGTAADAPAPIRLQTAVDVAHTDVK
jgi:O-antigen/teichoic acid export membrane protein